MKLIGLVNHYKFDPSGWCGSAIMCAFALLAGYRWHTSGLLFFGLLIIRDLAAAWFLISRDPIKVKSAFRFNEFLAYASSAWPLLYFNSFHSLPNANLISSIIAVIGFTISTLALFDLGSSFGVSPANRGEIKNGLYRYFRHPMYSGYIISEFGFVLLNPFNLLVWIISVSLYFCRTKMEERVLEGNKA